VIVNRGRPGRSRRAGGVRKGDVIAHVNSRAVNSPAELQDVVRAARVGQSVSVEVFRNGERRVFAVRLDARPGDQGSGDETLEAPEAPEAPEGPEVPGRELNQKHIIIRDLRDPRGVQGLDLPGGAMDILATASRGRLGVRIESLSPELGDYFGLRDGRGALVLEVLKGTPAERVGLKPGDVITRAGDRAVANGTDLVAALRGKEGKVALAGRAPRHAAHRRGGTREGRADTHTDLR